MIRIVKAYKEDNCWYIDDDNGFSKSENELVAGIPELIELIAGRKAAKVEIKYSDEFFNGSKKLSLIHTNEEGSTYRYLDNKNQSHEGWLCPVFFWYFEKPPKHLYINIIQIDELEDLPVVENNHSLFHKILKEMK